MKYLAPSVENIFLGLRPLKIFLPLVQYIPIFHAEGVYIYYYGQFICLSVKDILQIVSVNISHCDSVGCFQNEFVKISDL